MPDYSTDINRVMVDLDEQKTALVAYLLAKVKAGDWHAVQDAGSDIREIVAQLDVLAHL